MSIRAKQSIDKRYARMDETGTPFRVTVDGDTLTDGNVTIHAPNTTQQTCVGLDHVEWWVKKKISAVDAD